MAVVFEGIGELGALSLAQLRERLSLTTPSWEAHGTGSSILPEPGRERFPRGCADI